MNERLRSMKSVRKVVKFWVDDQKLGLKNFFLIFIKFRAKYISFIKHVIITYYT
jgi:hypothetical protein